ncbi:MULTISPECIES: WXG100-like domain-containing protein [Amycolatopsis]|uniref:Outer membrane channel protein CpnT-like N-terminal domain-containing protein n=1 Tax=Amycolatopsis bullii TaxID=941987 RepID=A0ABQ3KJW9_9PSEU|nr:papain-like cysteine protease family protein [Amycolatopsis bullii]GHG30004.1 hypothetical protein GCM10017567_57300 [Amycolatopsis bullii]
MTNELIAAPKDETKWYSGIAQAEEVVSLCDAIDHGDWKDATISGSGLAMDGLTLIYDPAGALGILVAAGLGWVMEHVGPLKKALDDLAGDPAVIKSYGQTWKNVAGRVRQVAHRHEADVKADLAGWTGPASRTYRGEAAQRVTAMNAAAKAADTMGDAVVQAGAMVATVRTMVRDTIATLVASLISALLPPGGGTAKAVGMIAKAGQKVARLIEKLTRALGRLGEQLSKLAEMIGGLIRRLRGGARQTSRTSTHVSAAGEPPEPRLAGAGGHWPTIDESPGGAVGQLNNGSCVSACGEMITSGGRSQEELIGKIGAPAPFESLAKELGPEWRAGGISWKDFHNIVEETPVVAELMEMGKMPHAVIVEGFDEAGNLKIRDPWSGGSTYKMTREAFNRVWTSRVVFK